VPDSAHAHDSRPDQEDSRYLPRRRAGAGERDGAGEHEHRRESARKRIHDRELSALVREREQREIRQLERARRGQVRPHSGVELPVERRRRRAEDRADEKDEYR
jgi:hypothetical protein